jgi:hypothetical protein
MAIKTIDDAKSCLLLIILIYTSLKEEVILYRPTKVTIGTIISQPLFKIAVQEVHP